MPRVEKLNKCNLDKLMQQHNLKLADLVDDFGVSYQQVQKYKAGCNEMPLVVLFKACQKLNCNPEDIYPEIEMYYSGYNIPTRHELSHDNGSNKDSKVTYNNYYYGFSNIFSKLFTGVKVLDTNAKGILLIKIAYFIVLAYFIVFFTWRAFRFHATDLAT